MMKKTPISNKANRTNLILSNTTYLYSKIKMMSYITWKKKSLCCLQMSRFVFLALTVLLIIWLAFKLKTIYPTKRVAAGSRPILFKSIFKAPDLGKYYNVVLPVKIYEGDCVTDDPEFEEYGQEKMTLGKFVDANNPFRQIKLAFPCEELAMGREINQFAREIEKKFTFLSKKLHQFRNFRISTKSWRFPQHIDPGNQLVLHLSGSKRWWLKNEDGTEDTYICEAGDVLYVPIGMPHRTENLSEMCCITNIGWSYPTDNLPYYATKTRKMYPRRAFNVDAGNDLFRP